MNVGGGGKVDDCDVSRRKIVENFDSLQWRRQVSEFGGAFEGQHAFFLGGGAR